MPRRPRIATGGLAYHVLNRAVGRMTLFESDGDYAAFERCLADVHERLPSCRLLSYCLMPNHWHLVLWPRRDGELSEFLRLLTVTHTQRWHAAHRTAGTGPLYQGRFKSFPIEQDLHLLMVCQYVERNPLRAKLVSRAAAWRWGSLHHRERGTDLPPWQLPTDQWPVTTPADWAGEVDDLFKAEQRAAIARSLARGTPFGSEQWMTQTAARLGLEGTLRPRGRPRKVVAADNSS
ncbi:MAG TPA: transposase [Tepidisphaeraceae bacterium]|jgi:putative transposase|nr:transposase [Tepidisphaeraceae bacterium]